MPPSQEVGVCKESHPGNRKQIVSLFPAQAEVLLGASCQHCSQSSESPHLKVIAEMFSQTVSLKLIAEH